MTMPSTSASVVGDPAGGSSNADGTGAADIGAIEHLHSAYRTLNAELSKVIVGQQQVIDEILIAIFTRSHALLVGVPGLAKTLLISTLVADAAPWVQACAVHARFDAVGHHRHGSDLRRPGDR